MMEAGRDCDVVLTGGRVIDPETGFDEIADVGIRNGRIVSIGNDTPEVP
jgi:predicted amidohydrolase